MSLRVSHGTDALPVGAMADAQISWAHSIIYVERSNSQTRARYHHKHIPHKTPQTWSAVLSVDIIEAQLLLTVVLNVLAS